MANYSLDKKIPILQIVKHQWILSLIKEIKSSNEFKPTSRCCIYTVDDHVYGGKVIYKGDINDFFLSADGKLEYVVITGSKTSSSIFEETEETKIPWTQVGNEREFLYVEGNKISNILMKQKFIGDDDSIIDSEEPSEFSFNEMIKYVRYSKKVLFFLILLWMLTILTIAFSDKDNLLTDVKKIKTPVFSTLEISPHLETIILNLVNKNQKTSNKKKSKERIDELSQELNSSFKTNGKYINVRSSPSKYAKIITNIHDKETEIKTLKEVPENDSWYEVELSDGSIGYIFSDLLSE